MPATIVERATAILGALEKAYGNSDMVPKGELRKRGKKATAQGVADVAESVRPADVQLSMFQLDDPVLVQIRDQIKGLDINSLTPLEALNKLNEIKNYIAFGGSPRASINLALAARTCAFIKRRGYVIPEDVREVAHDVLRHRIGLTYEAEAEDVTADAIINEILNKIEVP
jgi:MoxR-like ATPase